MSQTQLLSSLSYRNVVDADEEEEEEETNYAKVIKDKQVAQEKQRHKAILLQQQKQQQQLKQQIHRLQKKQKRKARQEEIQLQKQQQHAQPGNNKRAGQPQVQPSSTPRSKRLSGGELSVDIAGRVLAEEEFVGHLNPDAAVFNTAPLYQQQQSLILYQQQLLLQQELQLRQMELQQMQMQNEQLHQRDQQRGNSFFSGILSKIGLSGSSEEKSHRDRSPRKSPRNSDNSASMHPMSAPIANRAPSSLTTSASGSTNGSSSKWQKINEALRTTTSVSNVLELSDPSSFEEFEMVNSHFGQLVSQL